MKWRAVGLVAVVLAAACSEGPRDVELSRAPDATTTTSTTTTVPPSSAVPTTAAPAESATTTTSSPGPVVAAASGAAVPWTVEPYHGFGAWLDTYDWSPTFARSPDHVVGPEAIDHMAAEGVQTLYIQASRWNSPTDILDPERLQLLIDRAHGHGMSVVAWYLPTLEDLTVDLRRILAVAALDVDGIGIDIEARNVGDVGERNRRLVELSARLRASLPDRSISAIVLEPVLLEDVNPNYWPAFPWAEIAPYYDVWMPMSYWTNRKGEWRAAYPYTAENMARVRARIGQPDALVHTIGGIGDKTTVEDLSQMLTGAVEQRAIGGSIYDYRTTKPEFWATLRSFRRT